MSGTHLDDAATAVGRQRVRKEFATRLFVVFVVVFVVASTSIAVYNSFQNRAAGTVIKAQNTQILALQEQVKELATRIKSCTDHSGRCYRDGQKRSVDVVATINEYAVLASGCAAGYASLPEDERVALTRECVLRFLGETGGP